MNPIISIVICTYNRADILKDCLDASINQSENKDKFEIVVIDNNSSDHTALVVKEFSNINNNIHYFKETQQGLSHARNRGAKEANTEWLLFLDDDGLPFPDMVEKTIKAIHNFDFDCFGGTYYAWHKYKKPKWMSDSFGTKKILTETTSEITTAHLDGGIFIIKRNLLLEVGGFPTHLGMKGDKLAYGEEGVVQFKLLKKNYKLGFSPDIKMKHLVARYKLKLSWHIKSHFAIGRDNAIRTQMSPHKNIYIKVLSHLKVEIIRNTPKLLKKQYYWQNYLLDVLNPIARLLGEHKGAKKK